MAGKVYVGAMILLTASASMMGVVVGLEPKAFVSCLERLIPCAPYLQKPELPESCCMVLREMLDNNMACLCALYNSPSILTKINMTRDSVSQLPLKCGRPIPYCDEPKVDLSKLATPSSSAALSQVNVDIDARQAEDQSKTEDTSGSRMLAINGIFLAGLVFCSTFTFSIVA